MPCQYVLVLFNERDLEFQKEITETNETLETIADLIARAENLDVNDCLPGNICHLKPVAIAPIDAAKSHGPAGTAALLRTSQHRSDQIEYIRTICSTTL